MMRRATPSCKGNKKKRKSLHRIKILTVTIGSSWISCKLNSTKNMTSDPPERELKGSKKMKNRYQEEITDTKRK